MKRKLKSKCEDLGMMIHKLCQDVFEVVKMELLKLVVTKADTIIDYTLIKLNLFKNLTLRARLSHITFTCIFVATINVK